MLPPHQVRLKMIKSALRNAIRPHLNAINEEILFPFEAHSTQASLISLEVGKTCEVEERRQKECEFGIGEGRKENQSFGAYRSLSFSCRGLDDQSSLVDGVASSYMLLQL